MEREHCPLSIKLDIMTERSGFYDLSSSIDVVDLLGDSSDSSDSDTRIKPV